VGVKHPDTPVAMGTISRLFHDQKMNSKAEAIYREVLEMSKQVSRKEDLVTLELMSDLGLVLNEQGKHKKGEYIF